MPCQVAVLSSYGQDSVINLAVVDRLLAHQVNFTGFLDNRLPELFSDALLEGRLLLIDRASLLKLNPGERRKVEAFAREHVVQCFDYVRDPGDRAEVNAAAEVWVNSALSAAGVESDGDAMPEQDAAVTLRFVRERAEAYLAQSELPFNEFTVHHLRGLVKTAPERFAELLEKLLARQDLDKIPPHHDALGAWLYAPRLAELTGNPEWVRKFMTVLENVRRVRPRTPEGFIASAGNIEDPLNFRGEFPGYSPCCIGSRDLVYNELFHFHAPVFAAAAKVSRDPFWLDQLTKLMRHLRDVHCDPKDGLPCHFSSHGKPGGVKWSRGAAHIVHGLALMLEVWPDIPIREEAAHFADRIGEGLLRCQTKGGLWHNIFDKDYSPVEVSGAVGFVAGYAALVGAGWLPEAKYAAMLERGRHGILHYCYRGGWAENCAGTGGAPHPEYYLRRPFNFLFNGQLGAALA